MKYYVFNSSIVMYMYIVDTNQTKVMLFKEFEKLQSKYFRNCISYKNIDIVHLKECLHIFDEMQCLQLF